jgi:hypothetical protein
MNKVRGAIAIALWVLVAITGLAAGVVIVLASAPAVLLALFAVRIYPLSHDPFTGKPRPGVRAFRPWAINRNN